MKQRVFRAIKFFWRTSVREVFICDSIRTPVGRYGGGLSSVRADDLAAVPLKALLERNSKVAWDEVDDVN